MRVKNHNHMRYGSWDTEWDRHNLLSFWAIFFPFYSQLNWKNSEKMKKHLDMSSLYICVPKIIWCTEIWSATCPFTPLLTPKIKILKNKKNALRYYPFTNMYQKWKSYDARFQRYGTWLMQFLFFILGCFLALLPLWHLKKSKL